MSASCSFPKLLMCSLTYSVPSAIQQIIQLSVCREVVTMAFNCKAMTRTGTKLNVLGHYRRSVLDSFVCPKEPRVQMRHSHLTHPSPAA